MAAIALTHGTAWVDVDVSRGLVRLETAGNTTGLHEVAMTPDDALALCRAVILAADSVLSQPAPTPWAKDSTAHG